MKLLRITTDRADGQFDNQLNADLTLEPYSKIALSNASFTNDFSVLNIQHNNNTIVYNTEDGNGATERTVVLTDEEYVGTDSDGLRLFDDINEKMNSQLTLSGKEWGGQFNINKVRGRITLQYRITDLDYCNPVRDTYFNGFESLGTKPQVIYQNDGASVGDDSNRAMADGTFCKGAGVFRATINLLATNNTALNGFGIVLSESQFQTLTFPNLSAEDETYSIRCIVDPEAPESDTFRYEYRDGGGGSHFLKDEAGAYIRPIPANQTRTNGFADASNDVVELSIQQGQVVGTLYQTSNPGGVTTPTVMFTTDYNMKDLTPVTIIKGDNLECTLYNIRINRQQDFNVNPSSTLFAHDPVYSGQVSIPQPPPIKTANFRLDMSNSQNLAKFLGFTAGSTDNRMVYLRPNYSQVASFIGTATFALATFESYVIEFMSATLESYDGMSFRQGAGAGAKLGAGGQYSIIKVIPNYNTNVDNRVCNYEASNLCFIDMNNSKPLLLRNIRARVLDSNLQPITTIDVGVLTFLIKGNTETY